MITIYLLFLSINLVLSNDLIIPSSTQDLSHLSLNDFNSVLENNDYTFVLFYSSFNCTNCAQAIDFTRNVSIEVKQQFKERKLYKNYDDFVDFITIDCDNYGKLTSKKSRPVVHERSSMYSDEPSKSSTKSSAPKQVSSSDRPINELCNAYSIIDVPEWVLFRFGTQFKRKDSIENSYDLQTFLLNSIRTVSIRFHSFSKLITFLKQAKEPVVIGLFQNIDDRLTIDSWINSIEKTKTHWNYKELSFCHIFANYSTGNLRELKRYIAANNQDVESINLPVLILGRQKHMIHKREKRFLTYKFSIDKEDINQWIQRKIFGLIQWRSRDNEEQIDLPVVVAYFDFDFKNNLESSYKWRNWIYDLALKNADLNFALSHSNTFRRHLNNYKLTVEDYEPLFIVYDVFGIGFRFDDIYSEYEFSEFLNDFRAGKLKPLYEKTSSVSEYQTDNEIIELSALTFPKYVTQSKKDVFILFYANWCTRCKDSVKAMKELKAKMVKEDQLVLAQLECGDNDSPSKLDIDKYPTFYLYRPKTSSYFKFEEKNNLGAIINFITYYTTDDLVSFDRRGKLRTDAERETMIKKLNEKVLNKVMNNLDEKQNIDIKSEL